MPPSGKTVHHGLKIGAGGCPSCPAKSGMGENQADFIVGSSLTLRRTQKDSDRDHNLNVMCVIGLTDTG